jgi:hypothetical protein
MIPSSRSRHPLKIAVQFALLALVVAAGATGALARASGAPSSAPIARAAATCADYSNQAATQHAADTKDADSDGRYCENLPCPCSTAAGSRGDGGSTPTPPAKTRKQSCVNTGRVQPIGFRKTKYPNIRKHFLAAVAKGWPRILVVKPGRCQRPPQSPAARHPHPQEL